MQMTPRNLGVVDVYARYARSASYNLRGIVEVVPVMWTTLRIRDNRGYRGTPASRPPCPLLIVLALGRHISQSNGHQGPDVHPHLHGGCAAENIDRPVVFADNDVLEAELILLCGRVHLASISLGQLRGMLLGRN